MPAFPVLAFPPTKQGACPGTGTASGEVLRPGFCCAYHPNTGREDPVHSHCGSSQTGRPQCHEGAPGPPGLGKELFSPRMVGKEERGPWERLHRSSFRGVEAGGGRRAREQTMPRRTATSPQGSKRVPFCSSEQCPRSVHTGAPEPPPPTAPSDRGCTDRGPRGDPGTGLLEDTGSLQPRCRALPRGLSRPQCLLLRRAPDN